MYDAEDFFPPIAMLPNFDPGTLVSTSTVTVTTGSVCTAAAPESLPHTGTPLLGPPALTTLP